MKRRLFLVLLSLLFTPLYAQQEPEFIGEVLAFGAKGKDAVLLPKEHVSGLKANALSFSSFGYISQKATIKGAASEAQFDIEDKLQFIVRSVNQDLDPAAYIKVIYMKRKNDQNERIFSSSEAFVINIGFASNYNETTHQNQVSFTAKRFGENSYLVEIQNPLLGEYAFVTANPHNLNEISTIFATFGLSKNLNARNNFIANRHDPKFVADFLNNVINYLIKNKKRADAYGQMYFYDIFSNEYIHYLSFDELYGAGAHAYMLTEYPKAKKLAKERAKVERENGKPTK